MPKLERTAPSQKYPLFDFPGSPYPLYDHRELGRKKVKRWLRKNGFDDMKTGDNLKLRGTVIAYSNGKHAGERDYPGHKYIGFWRPWDA